MLLDYATGAQPRAIALAISGHLARCTDCRRAAIALEELGGELIRMIEPSPMVEEGANACLAKLAAGTGVTDEADGLPAILQPHRADLLRDLPWTSVGGLFDEVKFTSPSPGYRTSMLRVGPGRHVPEHGHEGNEFMLVLAGGYRSAGRHYRVGDFSCCDGSEEHMPVADDGEDCICLLVLDAPLAFRTAEGMTIGPLLAT